MKKAKAGGLTSSIYLAGVLVYKVVADPRDMVIQINASPSVTHAHQ